MGGKIDAYLDCVSPYSYFAFLELYRNKDTLKSYGIDVEFIPVFLGGINVATGNKPPGELPAKAKYSPYDLKRAMELFDVPNIRSPAFFPILSLLPQRAMIFVKEKYPKAKFELAFRELWIAMWELNLDISKPELLQETLLKHFKEEQAREILEATKVAEYKQRLLENTQKAVDLGAFGAPWMWAVNEKGEGEPFFGSDRFHYLWKFLGVPHTGVAILPRSKL